MPTIRRPAPVARQALAAAALAAVREEVREVREEFPAA
jgi:hypothetical protein